MNGSEGREILDTKFKKYSFDEFRLFLRSLGVDPVGRALHISAIVDLTFSRHASALDVLLEHPQNILKYRLDISAKRGSCDTNALYYHDMQAQAPTSMQNCNPHQLTVLRLEHCGATSSLFRPPFLIPYSR